MTGRPEHSRLVRLGARAGDRDESDLLTLLDESTTVVSIDATLDGALETANLLLNLVRRMPGRIILLGEGLTPSTANSLARSADRIAPGNSVVVSASPPDAATARIHIGLSGHHREAVRVVPEGYGAHLLADPDDIAGLPTRRPNRLGCTLAAAFGAGEAFNRNAHVSPARGRAASRISFCPVSLSSDLHAAPDLLPVTVDLALLGNGAIGTAIALILADLPLDGRIMLADRQHFTIENVGTYSIGTVDAAAANSRKVDLVADVLPRFKVIRIHGEIDDLPRRATAGEIHWPELVVSAVDSNDARRAAQRLWPDRLFDAATGDTTVGAHDTFPNGPCMECLFPRNMGGPSAIERLSDLTGLPVTLLGRDEPLTEADLTEVSSGRRARLRQLLGTPKCALARAYGLTDIDAGDYQPSVPFVSTQAACLGVGALVAHLIGVSRPTLFQYDALRGPQLFSDEIFIPRADCYCQQHRHRVETLRSNRGVRATPEA